MKPRICFVTDSTVDIPKEIAQQSGINIVPLYVTFGRRVYRDGVDIDCQEFYDKLLNGSTFPTTSQPTSNDFKRVYQELSNGSDGIVSIHISSKLSGTYYSALRAKEAISSHTPLEIIDSKTTSVAMGLILMKAVALAQLGANFTQVVDYVKALLANVRLLVLFDTLEYMAKGGRIGKAKFYLGSILNIKPLLTIKDGEFVPVTKARSRLKGLDKLREFVADVSDIDVIAIVHSTSHDDAVDLAHRINMIYPNKNLTLARFGPVLGAHGGPGVIGLGYLRKIPIPSII